MVMVIAIMNVMVMIMVMVVMIMMGVVPFFSNLRAHYNANSLYAALIFHCGTGIS